MTAELVFSKRGEETHRVALTTRRLTIGADKANEHSLASEGLAPQQCSIEHGTDGYVLVDRSGAGTVVNASRRSERVLAHGDRIQLGEHIAIFQDGTQSEVGTEPVRRAAFPPANLSVYLVDARANRHPIGEKGLRVGSGADNDLVITDSQVSRKHAVIFRRDGATVLRDLGSTNGTFIGNLRVTESEVPNGVAVFFAKSRFTVEEVGPGAGKVMPGRFHDLVYLAQNTRLAMDRVERFAAERETVFLFGEPGTGKRAVAQALHKASPHAKQPFEALLCPAHKENAMGAIFGFERRAAPGVDRATKGAIGLAGSGTLYLEDVGALSLDVQSALAKALESGVYRRVGGEDTHPLTCRVVVGSHDLLARAVREGRFLRELQQLFSRREIKLSPLRERKEEIPVLAQHLLERQGRPGVTLTAAALEMLANAPWPGNIDDLDATLANAVVHPDSTSIDADGLEIRSTTVQEAPPPKVYAPGRTMKDIADLAIDEALEAHGGNQVAAAEALEVDRATIARNRKRRSTTAKKDDSSKE